MKRKRNTLTGASTSAYGGPPLPTTSVRGLNAAQRKRFAAFKLEAAGLVVGTPANLARSKEITRETRKAREEWDPDLREEKKQKREESALERSGERTKNALWAREAESMLMRNIHWNRDEVPHVDYGTRMDDYSSVPLGTYEQTLRELEHYKHQAARATPRSKQYKAKIKPPYAFQEPGSSL